LEEAMAGRTLILGVLLTSLLSGHNLQAVGDKPGSTLYFITTPEAEGGPEGARRAKALVRKHPGEVRLRTVLLVRDWSVLSRVTGESPLTRTLRELEAGGKPDSLDIPLYDEQGLALAEKSRVTAVPAFILVRGGKEHRTLGASSNLDALWECWK
jgi:hypothetical protein